MPRDVCNHKTMTSESAFLSMTARTRIILCVWLPRHMWLRMGSFMTKSLWGDMIAALDIHRHSCPQHYGYHRNNENVFYSFWDCEVFNISQIILIWECHVLIKFHPELFQYFFQFYMKKIWIYIIWNSQLL